MELNKIYQEPCLETLNKMDDNSIDCVITSPPYWQLRDYGYDGQWGLEPTFNEYLEHLWSMMDLIYKKLKPEGTVWINLGDTYSTVSGNMKNPTDTKLKKETFKNGITQPKVELPNKCLLLIPHRFAIGCIDMGWIVRNDVIWAKRNGMPESVTDRFSKKHEYFFFMVKSEKYFFDLDAIRDKISSVSIERYKYEFTGQEGGFSNNFKGDKTHLIPTTKIPKEQAEMFGSPRARQHRNKVADLDYNKHIGVSCKTTLKETHPNGKNPGSVSDFWDVPTKPSSNKHYASYNDALLVKPVLAGCSKGGVIYDPFMGTGSTAEVALRSVRNFIGSEMSSEYCEIANKRLEPFLTQTKLF